MVLCSVHPVLARLDQVQATYYPMVGPGHVPVPYKLVAKITNGQFVDLADLLSANLRLPEQKPQTYLEGKLIVSSSKHRLVEVKDILTWTEAFTIYLMVLCAVHPQRWPDLTKYKLLIIQTARNLFVIVVKTLAIAVQKNAAIKGLSIGNEETNMQMTQRRFYLVLIQHMPFSLFLMFSVHYPV